VANVGSRRGGCMNGRRHTIALLAGIALLALAPLSADTSAGLKTEPWPDLLGANPATADAAVAQIQDRAKAVLANLLEAGASLE
jgi:hypothetical protein